VICGDATVGGECELPAEVGPCRGSFASWYYDTTMRKCLPFTYGGCRGNANRFETELRCTALCVAGTSAHLDLTTTTTAAVRYQQTTPVSRTTGQSIIIIMKRQCIRRSDMARVTTRASCTMCLLRKFETVSQWSGNVRKNVSWALFVH